MVLPDDHNTARDKSDNTAHGQSHDKSDGQSHDKSRDKSQGQSDDKSDGQSRDKSRDKSQGQSDDKSDDKSRDKTRLKALSGVLIGSIHRWVSRVYYADTDAGGVVYHGAYLNIAERARTEMLHTLACGYRRHILDVGMAFAVRRLGVDYRQPLRLDDVFEVESTIFAIRGARIDMGQRVILDDHVKVRLDVQLVCINHAGKVRRVPKAMADAMHAMCSDRQSFGQPLLSGLQQHSRLKHSTLTDQPS